MRAPVIAAVLLAASPVFAQDGFYIGAGGGIVLTPDLETSSTAPGFSLSGDVGVDTGFGAVGAAGYEFDTDPATGRGLILGLEGEIAYRTSETDDLSGTFSVTGLGTGSGTLDLDGRVNALSFMANGRAGVDTDSFITPFVLAGVGTARVSASDIDSAGVALVDDTDWVFAYQAGAGLDLDLGGGVSAEGTYRYLGTADPEFTAADGVTPVEAEYNSHSIFLVLKYKLGQ